MEVPPIVSKMPRAGPSLFFVMGGIAQRGGNHPAGKDVPSRGVGGIGPLNFCGVGGAAALAAKCLWFKALAKTVAGLPMAPKNLPAPREVP